MSSHKHITTDQITEIAALKRVGNFQKDIAKIIGVTPSAISQEIKKNLDENGNYYAKIAKENRKSKRLKANQRFKKIENSKWLQNHIEEKLKEHWSPEQISGRLKIDYSNDKNKRIGKDSIYNWINFKRKDLKKYLRCKKGKYRKKKGTGIREKEREEAKIKRIDTRPQVVEEKSRIGDYEGDTIIGGEKTKRLLTNVDRKSGYGMIDKLDEVKFEIVHDKIKERFDELPKGKKHTYTYDNGTELGKEDEWLEKKIGMEVYRAYPYHSWERGCNENFNGLVREFFPKGMLFANITEDEIKKIENLLNNRPRKRLNYYTPHEVFFEKIKI